MKIVITSKLAAAILIHEQASNESIIAFIHEYFRVLQEYDKIGQSVRISHRSASRRFVKISKHHSLIIENIRSEKICYLHVRYLIVRRFINSPFGVYQNLLNGTMKNDFILQLFTDFSPCTGFVYICVGIYMCVSSLMEPCKCDEHRELCAIKWINPIRKTLTISIKY